MPDDIYLSQLDPVTVRASNPLIATRVDMRDGNRGGTSVPPGELLFADDFQDQPDWHSGMSINDLDGDGIPDRIQRSATHTMPNGWFACYQAPDWAPSVGYPDRREVINILASDAAEWAMPGYSKCCLMTRDSEQNIWNSDSTLMHRLETPQDEVYCEFWIKFGPNWTWDQNSSSKLFRISCWNGQESLFRYFSDGNHGPIAIWNWNRTAYGVRMLLTFRGGPYGDNYSMTNDRMENVSFTPGSPSGAINLPWTTGRVGEGPNGTTAQLPDLVNGGFLSTSSSDIITHPQLFGTQWNKIGFYVKMQSAVNVADGQFAFWLNDKRVWCRKQVNWCPTGINGTSELPKWNVVDIGGNDNFSVYPNSERRQEYYAFQRVNVYRTRQPWAEWDDE